MPHELIEALKARAKNRGMVISPVGGYDNTYRCDNIHVIIAPLSTSEANTPEDLRAHILPQVENCLEQALSLYKTLPGSMINDLNLFFIAEPTAANSHLWRGLNHEIERDSGSAANWCG